MPNIDEGEPEFRIAEHKVTDVTRETAQVGCTKVTRADVEKLLKQMDAALEKFDFKIEMDYQNESYINFVIRDDRDGWLSAHTDKASPRAGSCFDKKSAYFCLDHKKAERLLFFLAAQLGFATKRSPDPYYVPHEWRY